MNTPVKARRRQAILATLSSFYDVSAMNTNEFGRWLVQNWIGAVHPFVVLGEREMLEYNTNFRQILPYNVLRRPKGDTYEYLFYQRTKLVGEERLGQKYSIGFGDHIDAADVKFIESRIELAHTLVAASEREMNEELVAKYQHCVAKSIEDIIEGYIDTAFIVDSESDVEKVHVGLCNLLQVYEGVEFECREKELALQGWRTLDELRDPAVYESLERWTQILIDNLGKTEAKAFIRTSSAPFSWTEVYGPYKVQNSSLSGAFVSNSASLRNFGADYDATFSKFISEQLPLARAALKEILVTENVAEETLIKFLKTRNFETHAVTHTAATSVARSVTVLGFKNWLHFNKHNSSSSKFLPSSTPLYDPTALSTLTEACRAQSGFKENNPSVFARFQQIVADHPYIVSQLSTVRAALSFSIISLGDPQLAEFIVEMNDKNKPSDHDTAVKQVRGVQLRELEEWYVAKNRPE